MGLLLLTKSIFAIIMGFLASTIFGLFFVPLMRKLKVKQNISVYMQGKHKDKAGTPTFGGLIFIIPTLVITFMLIAFNKLTLSPSLGIILLCFVSYAFIGFLDDYLSIKRHDNTGLTAYQKFMMQMLVALVFFYIYINNGGTTSLDISLFHISLEMEWLYGLFVLFVLVGSSNAVNLTDGLDGLVGGLSVIAFLGFSLISLVAGYEEITIFTFILSGAIGGFLMFNTYPAKIFMGDVGSLSLGAVMGAVAIITHREVTLALVALIFVIETLSVILQIIWLYLFKKKLFLMTPLHHHFEKLGYHETDIVKAFWTIGMVLVMLGIYYAVWL